VAIGVGPGPAPRGWTATRKRGSRPMPRSGWMHRCGPWCVGS